MDAKASSKSGIKSSQFWSRFAPRRRLQSPMQLKRIPQDFRVEERTTFDCSGGPFATYRLEKRSIGTPEATQIVLRSWNLQRQQISYGGLKDRHAETIQYLTIFRGPARDLLDRSLRLTYLGQAGRAFGPQDIQSNRFDITLRGIQTHQWPTYRARLESIQEQGLINYFDDQRFGSLGESGQFIAQPWCLGDYQRALFLAMAESNDHDRPREKEQKAMLREHWGHWQDCKNLLDRSHRRSIVTYLCDHPTDFRRAIALIRSDLRGIYVAAFQSYLWNRWLSDLLRSQWGEGEVGWVPSRVGPLCHPIRLSTEQKTRLSAWQLPLPTARQSTWNPEEKPCLDALLQRLGMQVSQLRLKYPRDTFFSKGLRNVWLGALDFQFALEADDLHRGKQKLLLSFSLPRGCYATLLVKWITAKEPQANGRSPIASRKKRLQ
jgi:tRNA pseudouridine13 synthase